MPDTRTRRQKLEAMAAQTASPREAEIARRLLMELDDEPAADAYARELFGEGTSFDDVIDDFLRRYEGDLVVSHNAFGVRVDFDGFLQPGALGGMLRVALRNERPLIEDESRRLEDL